jgi:hypothetical protein
VRDQVSHPYKTTQYAKYSAASPELKKKGNDI